MSVITLGDDDTTIVGATLRVQYVASPTSDLLTASSANGQTPFFDIQKGVTGLITAKETAGAHGRALGVIRAITTATGTADVFRQLWYSVQPIAEPVSISYASSDQGLIDSRRDTLDVWRVVVPQYVTSEEEEPHDPSAPPVYDLSFADEEINVPVEIASLPNDEVIESVLTYDGYSIPSGVSYMTGLAMLGPDAALGDEGFYLLIDLGQYTFVDSPVVDLIHIGAGSSGGVVVEAMVDYLGEGSQAAVRVHGSITRGRWYFLVRDGQEGTGQIVEATYSPPTFPALPASGDGSASAPCAKCVVPPSDTSVPPADCSPVAPDPCGSNPVTADGSTVCGDTKVIDATGRVCLLNGSSKERKVVVEQEVTITKNGEVSLGLDSTSVTAGGGYGERRTVSVSDSVSFVAQGDPDITGNCGECRTIYVQVKACYRDWKTKKDKYIAYAPTGPGAEYQTRRLWRKFPCALNDTSRTYCVSKDMDEQGCTRVTQ